MARDIFIQDLPAGISSVGEIPDSFEPSTIGTRAGVISALRRLAPRADYSDPSWIVLAAPGLYHIEVNLGDAEELESFALHVAGGREADDLIADLLAALGLRALDSDSDTGLFEPPAPSS